MSISQGLPFDLVPLTELPQEFWPGLPVFHPMLQIGGTPYWRVEDYPEDQVDEDDEPGPAYDVGVVQEWWEEDFHPECPRVRFVGSFGSSLHYSADNLWVPEPLVKQLRSHS